jgi:tetratricopeptide (TPR) repeat protein
MERLAAAFPKDDEAQSFYALALLGLNQGVRDIPTYKRAGVIAEGVLRRNQDHPGGAHYTIHAYDDAINAPLGLSAARLYSKIAPAAPHAQHMTTHIFLAMGMWDDVVSQNVIASGHDHEHWQANHYTSWLGYGYLQQGRFDQARKHLETARTNYRRTARRGEEPSLLSMRAQYIINSERWNDPVLEWKLDTPNAGPVAQAMDAFARAYAALRLGRMHSAAEIQIELGVRAKTVPVGDAFSTNASVPVILYQQLRGAMMFEDGRQAESLTLLRETARLEDAIPMEFGPPDIVKPTHELLGELLLSMNQPAEAKAEFERSLKMAPGRARSLLGLGRAALAAGDTATARKALAELRKNWHSADSSLREVAELNRLIQRAGQ